MSTLVWTIAADQGSSAVECAKSRNKQNYKNIRCPDNVTNFLGGALSLEREIWYGIFVLQNTGISGNGFTNDSNWRALMLVYVRAESITPLRRDRLWQ